MVAFEQHGTLFVRKPVTASIPASRSNFEKKLQAAAGQPSAVADTVTQRVLRTSDARGGCCRWVRRDRLGGAAARASG